MRLLNVRHFPQATEHTCGPAALLSILDYYSHQDHTEEQLAKELNTCPNKGTSASKVKKFLKRLKLRQADTSRGTIKYLEKCVDLGRPAMVLWFDVDDWHWSVVAGYTPKSLIIVDPYSKNRWTKLDKKTFYKSWSRLAII